MSAFPKHSPETLKQLLEVAGGNADLAMTLIQDGIEGVVETDPNSKSSKNNQKS